MSRTSNLETLKIPSCSPQNTHNILQDQLTRRPGQKHPEHRPSNLENHLRKLSPPTLKINPSNLIYLTSQPCYSPPCISAYPSQNSQDPQEPLRPPRSRFLSLDRCGSPFFFHSDRLERRRTRRTPRALGLASERSDSQPERTGPLSRTPQLIGVTPEPHQGPRNAPEAQRGAPEPHQSPKSAPEAQRGAPEPHQGPKNAAKRIRTLQRSPRPPREPPTRPKTPQIPKATTPRIACKTPRPPRKTPERPKTPLSHPKTPQLLPQEHRKPPERPQNPPKTPQIPEESSHEPFGKA
ncbi:hypothetical protein PGTUg99_031299 [Puccinia graminis f. sp. tritici]|uniref:Uncharacterized protein n=1 Tax=Puccinia graminis f. sp. tritici TaxID=56615 RepID=A0A5B0SF61_PUCGR|nr:hypothetical protein PGTUg99_031299 [Puccinia graminis f. sp. tritici]